jgi:uncharacterized protein
MKHTFAAGLAATSALVAAACGTSSVTPAAPPPSTTTTAVARGLDCTKADGDVEKMICRDPQLMSLDTQLAAAYQDAVNAPGADKAALQTAQDNWRNQRDDCWKADDVHGCVLGLYRSRLVALQIADPDTVPPEAVSYRCPDPSKPFTARFYNQFDPQAAVLTWGADTAVVFVEQSGSGARYGSDGVEYWEHQGVVTVDFHGDKFVCKTP